jgi:protein ImuB
MTHARFCAVLLPAFRIERLGFAPEECVAVVAEQRNATRVVAASPAARSEGITAGMTITAARALLPDLLAEPLDESGEATDRAAVVEQFRSYSPRIGAWSPDTLVLEVGETTHLYGGEQGLLDLIAEQCARLGHLGRGAIADDPVAAVAIARCASAPWSRIPPGQGASALSELPLWALDPSPSLRTSLQMLGMERIGDFARLDAASVVGRYGQEGVTLHRIARGHGVTGGGWEQLHTSEISESVALGGPTMTLEPIRFVLPGLLARMCRRAAQRDQVVARLALRLVLECGPTRLVRVRVGHPTREAGTLQRLLETRIERLRVDAPVIEVGLVFEETSEDPGWQHHLLDRTTGSEDLPELLARLEDALGATSVMALRTADTWRPEHASSSGPPFTDGPPPPRVHSKPDPVAAQEPAPHASDLPRPTLLLPRPRPIDVHTGPDQQTPLRARLDGQWQALTRVEGPEHLQGDWWTTDAYDRQYWVVATRSGAIAWIFREQARWYLHGAFD